MPLVISASGLRHRCKKQPIRQFTTGRQAIAFSVKAQRNALTRSNHPIPGCWSQGHPIETILERLDFSTARPTLEVAMRRREAHAPVLHIRATSIRHRQLTAHSAPIQGPADRQLQTVRAHDVSRHHLSSRVIPPVIGMVLMAAMGAVITHGRLTGDTLAQGIRTCSRLSAIGVLTSGSLRGQQVRSIDQ